MEDILKYIKREKKLSKEICDLIPNRIEKFGLKYFLIQHLSQSYFDEQLLGFFINIENVINTSDKQGLIIYLDKLEKDYTKKLKKCKPIEYSSNVLVNITSLWDFEMIPTYLSYIENIKKLIK